MSASKFTVLAFSFDKSAVVVAMRPSLVVILPLSTSIS